MVDSVTLFGHCILSEGHGMMPGNSAAKLARGNREYPCIFHNLRIFLKGVHLLDERVEGCLVLYLYPSLIPSLHNAL